MAKVETLSLVTLICSQAWEKPLHRIVCKSVLISSVIYNKMAQRVKRLPARWETWVRSLGQEDPLEKEMATHSSTLAWKIPRTEKPGRLQSIGSQRVGHDRATSLSLLCMRHCVYATCWGEKMKSETKKHLSSGSASPWKHVVERKQDGKWAVGCNSKVNVS